MSRQARTFVQWVALTLTIAGLSGQAWASPAWVQSSKIFEHSKKLKANTTATVTSGTPGCITVETPQPIAVGNVNSKIKYKLKCVAGAAPCASIITITGTLPNGAAYSKNITYHCKGGCPEGIGGAIGLLCEPDLCLTCGGPDDASVYSDDELQCSGGCFSPVFTVPALGTWAVTLLVLMSLAGGGLLLGRGGSSAVSA